MPAATTTTPPQASHSRMARARATASSLCGGMVSTEHDALVAPGRERDGHGWATTVTPTCGASPPPTPPTAPPPARAAAARKALPAGAPTTLTSRAPAFPFSAITAILVEMSIAPRRPTEPVMVGHLQVGGGAPVAVQSMTNTDTADAATTAAQSLALALAGSELVRVTVNTDQAAAAVPEIRRRLDDAGVATPLIGDFHYNGHHLLTRHPDCAAALAKYRVNPGNVGTGNRRDDNFATICKIARDLGKAVRIGVNGGSLDRELVMTRMRDNTTHGLGLSSQEVLRQCMVESALQSTELAHQHGLGPDRVVISCKVSAPQDLIAVYRDLAERTRQPLHLGLTEAGMGTKGLVWSAAAMRALLADGIGDTIRVSLTPRPGGDRTDEVTAACELLQALGIRAFAPSVTACPGCGRTTSTTFQEIAERVERHVRASLHRWRGRYQGVEELKLAVMGCIVNGPGESRSVDIGISLPGSGETPRCPVFVQGEQVATLEGTAEELAAQFIAIIDDYVTTRLPPLA